MFKEFTKGALGKGRGSPLYIYYYIWLLARGILASAGVRLYSTAAADDVIFTIDRHKNAIINYNYVNDKTSRKGLRAAKTTYVDTYESAK